MIAFGVRSVSSQESATYLKDRCTMENFKPFIGTLNAGKRHNVTGKRIDTMTNLPHTRVDEELLKRLDRSWRTATARKTPPSPWKWLFNKGHLRGHILDFGCGHCYDGTVKYIKQNDWQNLVLSYDGWDPAHRPDGMLKPVYDMVTCIYVLNTIPSIPKREEIVQQVRAMTRTGGAFYFAVRRDKKALRGWTSKGTWQGLIEMNPRQLLWENAAYAIYQYFA